ncbi:CD209 antigen-like protein A [Stigmatopora argus]
MASTTAEVEIYTSVDFTRDKPSHFTAGTDKEHLYSDIRLQMDHHALITGLPQSIPADFGQKADDTLDRSLVGNSQSQSCHQWESSPRLPAAKSGDASASLAAAGQDGRRRRRCRYLAFFSTLFLVLFLGVAAIILFTQVVALGSKIKNMQARFIKLNASQAQWTIDNYCPKSGKRYCKACEIGWEKFESHCYLFNDTHLKTWEEARKECVRKNSQMAFVENKRDTEFIQGNSKKSNVTLGYWLGLKMLGGQWTWLDSKAPNNEQMSWIPGSDSNREGWCTISVAKDYDKNPKAVKCRERHWWICKKMALAI